MLLRNWMKSLSAGISSESHPDMWGQQERYSNHTQRRPCWKWTWRGGDATVCFSASSWELYQTKEVARIPSHRMGVASAWGSLQGQATMCNVGKPAFVWRVSSQYGQKSFECKGGDYRFRWMGRCKTVWRSWVSMVNNKNIAEEDHSNNFHKKGLPMWPRMVFRVLAVYTIHSV